MTPEIISSFLWRIRTGLRLDGIALSAGHGFADPNYRPPKLPYVSVIGPLDLQRESERDPPKTLFLWVQTPAYAAGAPRTDMDLVPASGQFHLRFDNDASVSLTLDFGALENQSFNDDNTGRQAAAVMQAALQQAADDHQFRVDGVILADASRLEQLRTATVRWQRTLKRFVISSGRRGPMPNGQLDTHRPSRVEIIDGPANLGPALGFSDGWVAAEGRVVRHRMPNPLAVAVDVRIDLWAGSQQELATVLDVWARITPTRGQLFIRPALPLDDIAHGDAQVRIQVGGECPIRSTLAQLEPGSGFVDRISGQALNLLNGAAIEEDALRLTGNANAILSLFEVSPIPLPWEPEHPGPQGYALCLGLRVDPGAADGHVLPVLTLEHEGHAALQLEIHYVEEDGVLQAQIQAAAEQTTGLEFASAVGQIASADLESGVDLHMVVDAGEGAVSLFCNSQRISPPPEAPVPGTPAGGNDMRLTLGSTAASPLGFRVTHLQIHGRPLGPTDPRLRSTLATAGAWSAGEPIAFVRTADGVGGSEEPFTATVVAVDGDTLFLDRPVQGDWPRGATMIFQRSLFFSQKQLRRRDDLMNKLYRIAIEYRVSAFLKERHPDISAALVETPIAHVRELFRLQAEEQNPDDPAYPARPASGRPGVKTVWVK